MKENNKLELINTHLREEIDLASVNESIFKRPLMIQHINC